MLAGALDALGSDWEGGSIGQLDDDGWDGGWVGWVTQPFFCLSVSFCFFVPALREGSATDPAG